MTSSAVRPRACQHGDDLGGLGTTVWTWPSVGQTVVESRRSAADGRLGQTEPLIGDTGAVLDPVDSGLGRPDRWRPEDARGRSPGRPRRCASRTTAVSSSSVNWHSVTEVPAVSIPPLAMILTTSTPRSARSATAAAQLSVSRHLSAHVPAVTAHAGERRARGQDRRPKSLRSIGSPVEHGVPAITQIPHGGDARGQRPPQGLLDDAWEFGVVVGLDPVQGSRSTVSAQVDMSVDQAGQNRALDLDDRGVQEICFGTARSRRSWCRRPR